MKTIYSLNEFYNAVMEVAKIINQDYVSARVEKDAHGGLKFSCYIHTLEWHSGKTMEEAIENIRAAAGKPVVRNIDVEIE